MVHKRIRQRGGQGKVKRTSSTEKFENKQFLSQLPGYNLNSSDFHNLLGHNDQISSKIQNFKDLSKNLQNIFKLNSNKTGLNYRYYDELSFNKLATKIKGDSRLSVVTHNKGAYLVMANNWLSSLRP